MTEEKLTWYMLFGDESAGGYGYWLFDTEQEALTAADGERSVDERCVGCFPSSRAAEARKILDDVCTHYPAGGEPDLMGLGKRIREIGGWNEF